MRRRSARCPTSPRAGASVRGLWPHHRDANAWARRARPASATQDQQCRLQPCTGQMPKCPLTRQRRGRTGPGVGSSRGVFLTPPAARALWAAGGAPPAGDFALLFRPSGPGRPAGACCRGKFRYSPLNAATMCCQRLRRFGACCLGFAVASRSASARQLSRCCISCATVLVA